MRDRVVPPEAAAVIRDVLTQAAAGATSDGPLVPGPDGAVTAERARAHGWVTRFELGRALGAKLQDALAARGMNVRDALCQLPCVEESERRYDDLHYLYRLRPGSASATTSPAPAAESRAARRRAPPRAAGDQPATFAAAFYDALVAAQGGTNRWVHAGVVARAMSPAAKALAAAEGSGARSSFGHAVAALPCVEMRRETDSDQQCRRRAGAAAPPGAAAAASVAESGPATPPHAPRARAAAAATAPAPSSAAGSGTPPLSAGQLPPQAIIDAAVRTVATSAPVGQWVHRTTVNDALKDAGLTGLLRGCKLGDVLSAIPALEPDADALRFRLRLGGSSSGGATTARVSRARRSPAHAAPPGGDFAGAVVSILSAAGGRWVKAGELGVALHLSGAALLVPGAGRKGAMEAAVAALPGVETRRVGHLSSFRLDAPPSAPSSVADDGGGGHRRRASATSSPPQPAEGRRSARRRQSTSTSTALAAAQAAVRDVLFAAGGEWVQGGSIGQAATRAIQAAGLTRLPAGGTLLDFLLTMPDVVVQRCGSVIRARFRDGSGGGSAPPPTLLPQQAPEADGGEHEEQEDEPISRAVAAAAARGVDPSLAAALRAVLHAFALDGRWINRRNLAYYVRKRGVACSSTQAGAALASLRGDVAFTVTASGTFVYRLAEDVELPMKRTRLAGVAPLPPPRLGAAGPPVASPPPPPPAPPGGADEDAGVGEEEWADAVPPDSDGGGGDGGDGDDEGEEEAEAEEAPEDAVPFFCTEAPLDDDEEDDDV